MRHLRWTLPAAVVLALCVSSPVAAHPPGGAVVSPSDGEELAEFFTTFIELPTSANPLYGTGGDPCVRLGPHGRTLVAISFGDVTCTAEVGTVVTTGVAHFCSSFDPLDSPFYATDRREQRRCARKVSGETDVRLSVDGGPAISLFTPRFTSYTPQTRVKLPADNAFGVPAGHETFTGFGWRANIRNLRVGRHVWTVEADFEGQTFSFRHTVNIVPRS